MKIIIEKNNDHNLNKFRNILIKNIKIKYKNFNGELNNLHKFINKNKINDLRMFLFNSINKLDWKQMIFSMISKEIFYILGQDLLIQNKLNISIQMPKDKTSTLPIHSDSWSADSPFQINLWIPLTDVFSTNSMFIKNDS